MNSPEFNPVVELQVSLPGSDLFAPRISLTVAGRIAWALEKLVDAGPSGVTAIEQPGPRWSHYIFMLRKSGITIETVEEKHGGAFAGTHARYVLRTPLNVVSITRKMDRKAA